MTRTLLIGVDGATFTVLDAMTREHPRHGVRMPFLKRFIESGAKAVLRSTPNPLTPPAWSSVMTGRGPGGHGVFDFIRVEDKGHEVYFTLYDSRDLSAETIWSIATRQARKVVALNFPMTSPPRRGSGTIMPGFVPWKHLRRNTSPRELFGRLQQLPGFDPRSLAWDFELEKRALDALQEDEMEQWVRYHGPREAQWYRIAHYLLSEDRPDFMAVLFDGTDKIQHQAWQFIDPSLDGVGEGEWERRMRDACVEFFRELDTYIEGLVTLAGSDTQVFIVSDHGFTTTTEVVRINTFLEERGYLAWREQDDSELSRKRDASNFANVDWEKTVAYCRTPSSNGISIRVAREPGEPGVKPEEYDALRARLIADLKELRDPVSGEALIKEILPREQVFRGPRMREAPDLTLVLRDHGFVSIKNLSPVLYPRPLPAGTHHPDGIFIAAGPGIRTAAQGDPLNIVDVAPTLLYSLGLPVPEDIEGQVPTHLFTAEHVAVNPLRVGPPTLAVQDGEVAGGDMEESDKDRLIAQLQMLGYME